MRTVQEYMTPGPDVTRADVPLREAGQLMSAANVHHLPVVWGDDLVGLLTADDLRAYDECSELVRIRLRVEDVMIPMPYAVAGSTPLREVVTAMLSGNYSAAVVRDDGRVTGVFTLRDALRALGEALAESEQQPAEGVPARLGETRTIDPRPIDPRSAESRESEAGAPKSEAPFLV